ncbi:MAG: anti-sigma factor [Rhodobacteraceae bacterium]|nr:anti-sigma factor [Paracoccaceae bacterium]
MTDTSLPPEDDDDALAGEYVLGVLDLADRLAAEARIKADPVFAARVTDWETRLSPLNDGYDPVPLPDLLPQIEARLFPHPAHARQSWRLWLAGATAAAALAVGVLVLVPPAPQAPLLATLGSANAPQAYEARHDGSRLSVRQIAGLPAPAGQSYELWIIAPDAAPVSLGLLGAATLQVSTPRPPAGWVLAVSVEPAGGSPTGAPTGPVILTAEIGA